MIYMPNWYKFAYSKINSMKKILIVVSLILAVFSFTLNGQTKPVEQVKPTDYKLPDSVNKLDANGLKSGYWIERQGELTSKGIYVTNLKTGNWIIYYSNNSIHKLEYYNKGAKDGICLQFDRKGKLTLQENYTRGLLHGQTIYYGQYTETPMSEISFANGKKNGQFRQYYDNSKIQEESNYKNDIKDGSSHWYNKNGKLIAEYNYKNGSFDGIQKTFYDNDTLQTSTMYLNNQLSGDYKEYYRNGKLKVSGKYVAGLKEATWTEFDELQKPQKVIKYKAGAVK